MRKSFTWFLSLLVLLTAFATSVRAQEDQETVELYAEVASYCYNESDDYTVTISVRDFIKLDSFELALVFNDDVFQYETVSGVHSSLSAGLTVSKTSDDIIDIVWDGTSDVTIGDDAVAPGDDIMVLHFSLIGFPGNTAATYTCDMDWGTADFWYNNGSVEDEVNTVVSADGSLTVDVEVTGVETTLSTEDCFGGDVTVTVTAPDADEYLFNEDADPSNWTAWTSSNQYLAAAGETVTIRLKDASGCISLQKTIVIPESVDPITFTVDTQNPTCYRGKGSVVISALGGTAPYTYYISPDSADMVNAIPKSNFQFSQDTGTFWVWVDDDNACADTLAWQMIMIEDLNTEVTGSVAITDVTCNGGSDGELDVTILEDGGAAAGTYEVSIDGGTTWGTAGDYIIEDLSAGDYNVVVRNTEGCEITIDNDVEIIEPAAITFAVSIDDISCGAAGDGAIHITSILPVGASGTYEVSVDDGATWIVDDGVDDADADAGEITVDGLDPTYYSILVRENGSTCTPAAYSNPNGSGNVVAVQSPDAISFDVDIADPLCHNELASIAIVDVAGGSGSYIYSFDGGTTWVDTTTIDSWDYMTVALDIAVSEADTSCTIAWPSTLDDTDVANPDSLVAFVDSVFAPTCIDGNDGNIHLNITGGVEPYYYSINGSIWKELLENPTSIKVNVGDHEILVMDANDCEIAIPIDTTVTLEESIIEATSDGNIDCFGDKAGTISVNFISWAEGLTGASLPNRDVQYWVENEAGVVSAFGPSNVGLAPEAVTTFNAGIYIVWVQDQYTCVSNPDTVVVTENDELLITDVNANGASCFESFDGFITITATGGYASAVNMLEYAVVNNEGALENLEEDDWLPFTEYNDIDFDPAVSTVSFYVDGGTYWIAVRDGDCDEVTWGPVPVTGYEELLVDELDIDPMDPLCNGESTGSITVPPGAVSGGAGAYKYTLLDGGMNPIEDYIDLAAGEFNGLDAGTYYVLVEDAEDCPPYTTGAIILTDPAVLSFTADYQHMSCLDANDGLITINVVGGTPGWEYAINSQNTWFDFGYSGIIPINVKTYIATEPGTFLVWVRDANGCIAGPDTITILEPSALGADITVDNNVSCYGESDGQISIVGTGGWAGFTDYEFQINDGLWTSATTIGSLPAGDHVLSIRDAYIYAYEDTLQQLDCVYTVDFTITEPDAITYDVVVSDVKCKDGSDGELMMEVLSGGTPFVDLVGDNDGFHVRLTGTGYDSGWLYTGVDNAHTFTGLAPSIYTLFIEDANGCTLPGPAVPSPTEGPYTTEESWEVNEPDEYLDFDAMWIQDATCYGSEDGEFKVVATGGTASYMYAASLSIPPGGGGHILVPTPDENSEATDHFTGWQESDTLMVGAGTWVVWVMDANGCIKGGEYYDGGEEAIDWRVQIEQPDQVEWAFHMVGSPAVVHYVKPSCFGDWDGAIHLVNISGGSGTYNAHVWGTSLAGDAVDTTYTDIEPETGLYWLRGVPASDTTGFEVTVMDDNGCLSDIDTIFVDQPAQLTVDLQKVDGFNCFGDIDGQIEAYPEGGTAPYEYQLWKNDAIHTPWQNLGSSFLVQAGNEFVVAVRDAKQCVAYDTIYIETPLEVEWTNDRLTCYGDTVAAVRINATGTPGRVFSVWYQEVNDGIPASGYVQYNGTFEESILIDDVFLYDNENFIDRHYAVYVEDDEGCPSVIDTLTFDAVATPLTMNVLVTDVTECDATMNISYLGGTAGYTVMFSNPNLGIVDSVLTEDIYVAGRGLNTIKVMDAHECIADTMIEVEGVYVTRDTMIETYFERSTHFVDAEAGVDMMLAVGIDTFTYAHSDNCERTLIVEIVEVSPAQNIMELQGETSSSPWVGYIVELAGTITGISQNEGFYMQDANEAWSGVWVQWISTGGLSIGDGVLVKGPTAEVTGVTTINATEVSGVDAPVVVEPVVLDSPAEAEAEMWESVLVKVESATATAAAPVTGEWIISYSAFDNVIVNDQMYSFAPVAEHIYHVTGVVSGRLDVYKMEPRMKSDIEPAAIKTVQGAGSTSPYVGTTVELMGTVSGISASEGFYMQDANAAWSGIWVQWTDTEDLEVGDGVVVAGSVAEVSAVTTINATSVMDMTSDLTLEAIVLDSPSDVAMEMYESVLVMVDGARAMSADEVTGEWTIYYEMMDDATVNDFMYSYSPTEGNFYDVTGVVNGRLDDYKLEPRMEEDIVDLSATPATRNPLNIEFGVYPNPFNDRINLKNNDKLSRVVISNIAGQRVIDVKYPKSEIRTAKLVSGVYIVSMYTEDGIAKSVRIVKR